MQNNQDATDPAGTIADEGLRCPECGYNLTGLDREVCPECGRAFDVADLRDELAGRRFTPVPTWTTAEVRPFLRTCGRILFAPRQFVAEFPLYSDPSSANAFRDWCHAIAVLVLAGSAVALGIEPGGLLLIPAIWVAARVAEALEHWILFSPGILPDHNGGARNLPRNLPRFLAVHLPIMSLLVLCAMILAVVTGSDPHLTGAMAIVAGILFWWFRVLLAIWTLRRSVTIVCIALIMLVPITGLAILVAIVVVILVAGGI